MIEAGTYQRGETVTFRLAATDADIATVVGLPTSDLKAMVKNNVPSETAPVVVSLSVAVAGAEGTVSAGWTISLSAAQTLGLATGRYVTDVRIVTGGGVFITSPLAFTIVDAVTA